MTEDHIPTPDDSFEPEEASGGAEDRARSSAGEASSVSSAGLPARVRAAAPDVARKGILGAALVWVGFTTAFPLILIAWVLAMFLSVMAVAELLEKTDGLAATTFGAGYVIGAVTLIALVLAMVGLKLLDRGKQKRPLRQAVAKPFALPAVTFLAMTFLAAGMEGEGIDVPDVLTTAAFLGVLDIAVFLLPVWLAVAVVGWAWRTFVWAGAGPYRSGFVTGLAIAGGVLLPATFAALDGDAEAEFPEEFGAVVKGLNAADSADDLIEFTHVVLDTAAAAIGPPRPPPSQPRWQIPSGSVQGQLAPVLPTRNDRFGECAQDLAEAEPASRSQLDLSIGRLIAGGTPREDALDVAHLTLLVVCEKYADGTVREYLPYFIIAVGNNATNRASRERLLFCDVSDLADRPVYGAPLGGYEYRDAERAFCRLTENERRLLLATAQGYTSKELGDLMGISPAAARQRVSRARASLRGGL